MRGHTQCRSPTVMNATSPSRQRWMTRRGHRCRAAARRLPGPVRPVAAGRPAAVRRLDRYRGCARSTRHPPCRRPHLSRHPAAPVTAIDPAGASPLPLLTSLLAQPAPSPSLLPTSLLAQPALPPLPLPALLSTRPAPSPPTPTTANLTIRTATKAAFAACVAPSLEVGRDDTQFGMLTQRPSTKAALRQSTSDLLDQAQPHLARRGRRTVRQDRHRRPSAPLRLDRRPHLRQLSRPRRRPRRPPRHRRRQRPGRLCPWRAGQGRHRRDAAALFGGQPAARAVLVHPRLPSTLDQLAPPPACAPDSQRSQRNRPAGHLP